MELTRRLIRRAAASHIVPEFIGQLYSRRVLIRPCTQWSIHQSR